MYILLFLQFSAISFYDPARRALEPQIVPKKVGVAGPWPIIHCLSLQQWEPRVYNSSWPHQPSGSPACAMGHGPISHQVRLQGLPPLSKPACALAGLLLFIVRQPADCGCCTDALAPGPEVHPLLSAVSLLQPYKRSKHHKQNVKHRAVCTPSAYK